MATTTEELAHPTTRRPAWVGWVSLVARLGLAVVWLAAAWPKLTNLALNAEAVRAYEIFPWDVAGAIGRAQPIVELALGILLLIGLFTRASAIASAVLFAVFIAGIASAWSRGLRIDCGCFAQGGSLAAGEDPAYLQDILRDVGFLVLAAWLAWRPRTPFSVDRLLRRDA